MPRLVAFVWILFDYKVRRKYSTMNFRTLDSDSEYLLVLLEDLKVQPDRVLRFEPHD